jgi:excisionase family DNA binding protein
MLMPEGDHMLTAARHALAEQPSGAQADGQELSPAEAVAAFNLSQATLRRLLAAGSLPARKVNGVRGREWRIPVSALEDAGYTRRAATNDHELVPYPELRRLQQIITTERARASHLDSQLGYALLTIGRLRGRLRDAGIDPDELFGADFYADRKE